MVHRTDLGAQDTGGTPLLNYCNNPPKPSSCGTGPFTDAPLWYANGTTICGTTYTTPMVVGNVADTSGAYDWFLPSSNVRGITFAYHVQSGFPIMQLWLAAQATSSTITGTVEQASSAPIPAGTNIDLQHADGTPVLDIQSDPVVVPVPRAARSASRPRRRRITSPSLCRPAMPRFHPYSWMRLARAWPSTPFSSNPRSPRPVWIRADLSRSAHSCSRPG
jgi:hypothetical protein